MSGLTPEGFKIKRLPEIKQELEDAIENALQAQIDFSPDTPDGQISALLSEARANLWMLLEKVYFSQYPSTASGVNLDLLVDINGLSRLAATKTFSQDVVVFGDVGITIPSGSLAKNSETEDDFSLVNSVTLSLANSVYLKITVDDVQNNENYSITIDGVPYTILSPGSATENNILVLLANEIPGSFETELFPEDELLITSETPVNFSDVDSKLTVEEVGNLAFFQAVEAGRKLLPAGALSEIETPISGWIGLENRSPGVPGRDRETDFELRARRAESISLTSTGTVEAIASSLRQLEGVIDAIVAQNSSTVTDSNGIPPQHVWAIVSGGDENQIAEIIFRKLAAGIGMKGNEVVFYFSDVTLTSYEVRFDRPTPIEVYISMDLTINQDFPLAGENQIKTALENLTSRPGETLFFSRLYSPINSVPGHFVNSLFVGLSPGPTDTDNILVDLNEQLIISSNNVNITFS